MARSSKMVAVGRRKIELSNLKKVLFPEDSIIKAELIEYYLKIAPTILRHVKGRPLTLVRYPDGIYGESFFQKNRPEWTPDWIAHAALGGGADKTDYIIAQDEATLVWLANLACVELHQMHCRRPAFDRPDYIVYDLDPPENYPFTAVVELALELREHVEKYGYHTFVKTTGGKGLHLVTPIKPAASFEAARLAAADVAKPFVQKHSRTTTLNIKKDARKGRVLMDIYRNSTYQTIVSPYSVRGKPHGPVSMPLGWGDLMSVTDPVEFNLRNGVARVVAEGDPWETIDAYATPLHTDRSSARSGKGRSGKSKTPESLSDYAKKRRFSSTPEPPPGPGPGDGDSFVLHRHHASRLHYDLRIEQGGALKSFAIPKGLPPRPGIKRLAVNTEDHPLEYRNFEGSIPKGEYGGGDMWIFAGGRYEITKQKKDGFYLRLNSEEINAEYRMINTRGKDWLVERLDRPQVDWLHDPVDFMLAGSRDRVTQSPDYIYEVKWDGIRAMISLDEGNVTIRSRSQRDVTRSFPELLIPEEAFRATSALFDAEIVCLDEQGRPIFEDVVHRLHHRNEASIARARRSHPAVCYVFDCLYLDGRPIINEPLERRKAWMADSIRSNPVYRVSESLDEGVELFRAASALGLEGIMAKQRSSPYRPGRRVDFWTKIKTRRTAQCIILGHTRGKGDRESTFGALQLGLNAGKKLKYIGKVGSGFDERLQKEILKELKKLKEIERPIEEKPIDDAVTVWVEPVQVCEVQYASRAKTGNLREPVFLKMRPDLGPEDCGEDQLQ